MIEQAAIEVTQPRPAERRRHSRIEAELPGRFMRESRAEFNCVTIDISLGGIAFASTETVNIAERIVAYLENLGRFEGCVARKFREGFAVAIHLPQQKRERFADQLTWLATQRELGLPDSRRHERIRPRIVGTRMILPSGEAISASIVDVSRSGVALSLSSSIALPVGMPVTVGSTKGWVVRESEDYNISVEFARPIRTSDFDEDVIL